MSPLALEYRLGTLQRVVCKCSLIFRQSGGLRYSTPYVRVPMHGEVRQVHASTRHRGLGQDTLCHGAATFLICALACQQQYKWTSRSISLQEWYQFGVGDLITDSSPTLQVLLSIAQYETILCAFLVDYLIAPSTIPSRH